MPSLRRARSSCPRNEARRLARYAFSLFISDSVPKLTTFLCSPPSAASRPATSLIASPTILALAPGSSSSVASLMRLVALSQMSSNIGSDAPPIRFCPISSASDCACTSSIFVRTRSARASRALEMPSMTALRSAALMLSGRSAAAPILRETSLPSLRARMAASTPSFFTIPSTNSRPSGVSIAVRRFCLRISRISRVSRRIFIAGLAFVPTSLMRWNCAPSTNPSPAAPSIPSVMGLPSIAFSTPLLPTACAPVAAPVNAVPANARRRGLAMSFVAAPPFIISFAP